MRHSFVTPLPDSGGPGGRLPPGRPPQHQGHRDRPPQAVPLIFYLYAPTLDAAQSVAKDANGAGYGLRPEVGKPFPEYPDNWPVTCEANVVISPDFLRETGNLFDGLAARYHAEYDGWQAATTP